MQPAEHSDRSAFKNLLVVIKILKKKMKYMLNFGFLSTRWYMQPVTNGCVDNSSRERTYCVQVRWARWSHFLCPYLIGTLLTFIVTHYFRVLATGRWSQQTCCCDHCLREKRFAVSKFARAINMDSASRLQIAPHVQRARELHSASWYIADRVQQALYHI